MAAGDLGPSSGSTIAIGTTAEDGLLDTYTQVGKVANMGELGRVYALITFDDLSERNTLKFKGQRNDGQMTLEIGHAANDAGQQALIDALDDDNDYNFRVRLNDDSGISGATGTTKYFKAKVMSYPIIIGAANNVVMSRVVLELKSGSLQTVDAV